MKNTSFKVIVLMLLMLQGLSAQQSISDYHYQWLNLGMSETPDKSQTIQWRTDTTMQSAVIQFKKDIPAPDLSLNAQTITATSAIYNDYGIVKSYHKVTLENLLPDTKYIYRIGDGNKWSEWIQFKTAKSEVSPFTFTYVADVQSGILSHYPRVLRKSIELSPESSFYLFTGDLTEKAEDEELNNFFYSMSWVSAMKPIVAIPDNHEYHVQPGQRSRTELATVWGHLFSYPQNAPDSLARLGNYVFDFQGTRFIMLNNKAFSDYDSDGYKKQLLNWMENYLKNNPNKWTIIAHHQPMYSLADSRANKTNTKYLKPLYEKYGVDLVLSGHDHGYSRISNRGNFAKKSKIATPVYVVSVAGEQMYASQYPDSCDRMASNTQFFQKININNNTLNFKTFDAVGELYDEFDLIKKNNTKTIINKIPAYAERTDLPPSRKRKYTDVQWQELENRKQEYLKTKNIK